MDFDQIMRNLSRALGQLAALRLVVSSRREKVGDLPAAYVALCALLAPALVVCLAALGFVFRYSARFERDATVL